MKNATITAEQGNANTAHYALIAFAGVERERHGVIRPWRRIHRILDVNEGETLCGLVLADAAPHIRVTVPRRLVFEDSCGTCTMRARE